MSRLDLLVGPNGAGKTTFFERIIAPDRPGLPFVNADRIAAARFPGEEVERAYDAARIAGSRPTWRKSSTVRWVKPRARG